KRPELGRGHPQESVSLDAASVGPGAGERRAKFTAAASEPSRSAGRVPRAEGTEAGYRLAPGRAAPRPHDLFQRAAVEAAGATRATVHGKRRDSRRALHSSPAPGVPG